MRGMADNEQAKRLLANMPDMASPLEQSLLKVAKGVFLPIERVRVLGIGEPGHALLFMATYDRRGHAGKGYVGVGIETDAVAADNLTRLCVHVAEQLALICRLPRIGEAKGGDLSGEVSEGQGRQEVLRPN